MTPTLSTLRKRIYELDAKRTQGELQKWAGLANSFLDSSKPDEWPVTVKGTKVKGGFPDDPAERVLTAYSVSDQGYFATMPDAVNLIREQHRLLMEAKGIIEECHDQLWHLAKEPESNVLVQKAKAFLRQLEESGL